MLYDADNVRWKTLQNFNAVTNKEEHIERYVFETKSGCDTAFQKITVS